VISSLSTTTTTTDGGTAITILGSGFESGALVTVGGPLPSAGTGLFADNIVVKNGTTITITAPAFPIGPEDVTVINPDSGETVDSGGLTYTLGNGPINYVQRGDAATGSGAQTIPVPMSNPQTKGNLNAVIIGWSDVSAQVSSVTDTEGNTYQQALNAIQGASLSQVVYYAKNIVGDSPSCTAPNCNTITINFNRTAASPDVRVLEYSGLDGTSPLDQGASAAGAGALADTGGCFTTSASELILSGTTVSTNVTSAGANFTTVDYTNNGDNAEHAIASAVGSCEATTVMTGGSWVTQVVTFKAGSAGAASFTLTADPPTSQSVAAGSSASYALTLAAVNGFSTGVTLTCSGLPTGASCGFTPPSPITPGSLTADALTITTAGTTPAGTSTVTVTGTAGSIVKTATVSLTVTAGTAPGFTMAATALSPATIAPGATSTSTITITPVNGFTGSVSFSCAIGGGGTPAPTCSFSTVTNGSSTLTVSTTGNSAANSPRSTGLFYALLLPIGGMTLLGAGFSSRRKQLLGILLICMMIAGFIFMTACSSGSSSSTTTPPAGGTPAGTYTITVSGTATGATTQTLPLTVVVN
jgi:hypothetical protein